MEITLEFIKAELEGFYPNSNKLTSKILGEMFGMLKRLRWTEDDFSKTLTAYRNDPLRAETKTLNIPPDVRQLIQLWKKGNQPKQTSFQKIPPPAWYKGSIEALRKNGRLGLALYMVEQAQNPGSKLDLQVWMDEAEYCLNRESPKNAGNLAGALA